MAFSPTYGAAGTSKSAILAAGVSILTLGVMHVTNQKKLRCLANLQ
jgi:hypothetical protein